MTPWPMDDLEHVGPADALIVVPLIRLPSEIAGTSVKDQKNYIRNSILGRDNRTLFEDPVAWNLLCTLGGDLMINAFATNFKIDGEVNQDVVSQLLPQPKQKITLPRCMHTLNNRHQPGRSQLPQPMDLLQALCLIRESCDCRAATLPHIVRVRREGIRPVSRDL